MQPVDCEKKNTTVVPLGLQWWMIDHSYPHGTKSSLGKIRK
jgi:hypothetical protein